MKGTSRTKLTKGREISVKRKARELSTLVPPRFKSQKENWNVLRKGMPKERLLG